MGIGSEGLKKLIEEYVGNLEEKQRINEQLIPLYIEFGYLACERGESLQEAIDNYRSISMRRSTK